MANKFQLRRLTARALELALDARDWPHVAACKSELHAFEMEMAAGLSVRTHLSLADNKLPDIFHIGAEGRHGPSPGLLSVKTEDEVAISPSLPDWPPHPVSGPEASPRAAIHLG